MVSINQVELYSDSAFLMNLRTAVEEAAAEQRSYTVMACVPKMLPHETASEEVIQVVADCMAGLLRDEDLPGLVEHDIVAVGLPDTGDGGAQVLAHRLQSELTLRSTPLRNTTWDAGYACLPEDGLNADELLAVAVDLARNRRRRLGR